MNNCIESSQCLDNIYSKAASNIADIEIWQGYYKLRYKEFIDFLQLFPHKEFDQALEIGCGIGYQAALLSCLSTKVVATDVDFGQMKKHSRGIDITREFIARLGKKNIEVVMADAQELPFKDEYFDFVYCSYSFQYIPDKRKALQEIRRVLKNEGYFFCIVPTATHTININFSYYKYLLGLIFRKKGTGNTTFANNESYRSPVKKRKWRDYVKKIFPIADDPDAGFIKEILSRFPFRWKKLFKKHFYLTKAIRVRNKKNFISKALSSFFSASYILIVQKK